jgi:hypothetical protein
MKSGSRFDSSSAWNSGSSEIPGMERLLHAMVDQRLEQRICEFHRVPAVGE